MNDSHNHLTKKLPLMRILILSFQLITQRFKTFLRIGFPIIVLLVFGFFMSNNDNLIMSFIRFDIHVVFMYLLLFLIWALFVMVVVGCHRSFLLNETEIQQTHTFRWQTREWKFLFWGIFMGIFFLIISFLFGLIISILGIENINKYNVYFQLVYLPLAYVFSRWSLVFPATAVEDPETSLVDAWVLSNGNGLRLTFLIVIVPFIIDFLFSSVIIINSVFMDLIITIIWLIVAVYEIGLLSLSYAFLKGNFRSEEKIV